MAEKRLSKTKDIPWKGTLSLLVKKKKKYTFLQLYFHLVPKERGTIWMMGYKGHTVGSELIQEFQINAFTRDFDLPEVASPQCSGGEHPICLQTPDDVIFFSADSEQKREEVFQRLSSHFNLRNLAQRAERVEPAPEVLPPRHDQHGSYYDEPSKEIESSYVNTYSRQRGTELYHPYGYAKIDEGIKKESIYTEDDARSYEEINCTEPVRSPPPVPQRDFEPKNRPSRDTDNISEASTVDEVANLREVEANIGGTDSLNYQAPIKRANPSLPEFVQTFRSEKFKSHLITKHKRDMNWKDVKLCLVEDKIRVAGLSHDMYKQLHVGDIIMKVNNNSLSSVNHFYVLIESSDTDEIELEILRVPNGCLCHVTLPANGQINRLGVSFSPREKRGVEVIKIEEYGLVFKSHDIQNCRPEGVMDSTKRVNWGLVEINQKPVPLHSSKEQVEQLLRNAGIELALVLLPMDLVHRLRAFCPE